MKARWLGSALTVAALAGGCGAGRAILNVDIYSWLKGTGKDTIPYFVPPGASNFPVSNVPQKINLVPGAGSSFVDTVKVDGTANLVNSAGTGTIGFQVYLAADSAGTYAARAGIFNPAPSGSVSGTSTTPIVFGVPNLSTTIDSLFTKTAIWVRMVALVSNPGVVAMRGNTVLMSLQLRIVVEDKIF